MPEVPRGFQISIFADHLSDARWMAVAPNGDIFLAEPTDSGGKITILRDTNGDGKVNAEEMKFMLNKLGISVCDQTLRKFISDASKNGLYFAKSIYYLFIFFH